MKYLILIFLSILIFFQSEKSIATPFPNADNSSNGMTYSWSGLNPDASVIWIDPAAINNIDSVFSIALSLNAAIKNTTYQSTEPSLYQAISDNAVLYPLQANVTAKINSYLSLGLSIHPKNSEHINWQEENWTGRFLIRDYHLSALVIQPAIGIKLSDVFSVGGGLVISSYQLNFNRSLPLRDINREARQTLDGKTTRLGINAGLSATFENELYLSINYKSGQTVKFNNSEVANTIPGSLSSEQIESTTANIDWTIPQNINLSGSYLLNPKWEANASLGLFFYLNDPDVNFDLKNNTEFLKDFSIVRSGKPEIVYRLGLEFSASDYFSFRAGSWYSQGNADKNFLFPVVVNGPRIGWVAGSTFRPLPGLTVTLDFATAHFFENSGTYIPGNFGGKYKTMIFNPGFGVSYSF